MKISHNQTEGSKYNSTSNSKPTSGSNSNEKKFAESKKTGTGASSRPSDKSTKFEPRRSGISRRPGGSASSGRFNKNSRDRRGGGRPGSKGRFSKDGKGRGRDRKFKEDDNFETNVIQVKRVTKVVKGGKNMRFSALVVVGDRAGNVGFALRKGTDYQDSVAKATKKAKERVIKLKFNDAGSVDFPVMTKHKAAKIFLKPAHKGTGLIAGGFLRPVLELAGFQNIYSKIIGSNNKTVGVQASFKALQNFTKNKNS